MSRYQLVVFDVNETLSDLAPLAARFAEVGAPEHLVATWFAGVLRDGLGLAAAGGFAPFAELARAGARSLLTGVVADPKGAAEHVLAGLADLDVHPDVPGALRRLRSAGLQVATLTNGSVALTERLLARAGLLELVGVRLDVAAVRRWKPAPEPYRHALAATGVAADRAVLVACHPWDVAGAQAAGLGGAWVNREGRPYPEPLGSPDIAGASLGEVADAILAG